LGASLYGAENTHLHENASVVEQKDKHSARQGEVRVLFLGVELLQVHQNETLGLLLNCVQAGLQHLYEDVQFIEAA
jgi:hypothetical protein